MFALAVGAVLAGAAPPAPQPRIVGLEARLFLANSGRLSDNVLSSEGYYGTWNAIIDDDPANDALILVKIGTAPQLGEEAFVKGPLTITARSGRKLLGQRRFPNFLIPARGTSAQALYLSDIGCAGHVLVTARLGSQTRTAKLDMICGE
jgi:hypothetical protein